MQRAVLFVMVLSCLFVAFLGCPIKDRDNLCKCACEDVRRDCRATCRNIVYKEYCYMQCSSTASGCYNSCYRHNDNALM